MGRRSGGAVLLSLFPGSEGTGGVEASGRLAWEGLQRSCSPEGRPGRGGARRFCYCGGRQAGEQAADETTTHAETRARAVAHALRAPRDARAVLVWHVDLLKLLPLFRVPGARVALFLHGIEAWRRHDRLTRLLLRRVDLFLTNSDYTWQRFIAMQPRYAAAPHRTVHLGVGLPAIGPAPDPAAPPAALMLGRMAAGEDYKGHRELIAAWPLVLERLPSAELWIAGPGDLRPTLERLAAGHAVARSVRFWGYLSEDQKQELLARSRCLALPSRAEGFGLVYPEAMRLGRPCLVSTVDAGREVVAPPTAGLAADPDRPEELAAAVCRLLDSGPEWRRWSDQARARYHAGFTASHFQQRLLDALSDLVRSDHPTAPVHSRRGKTCAASRD